MTAGPAGAVTRRYAAAVVRLRWFVVIAWAGLAVAAVIHLPTLAAASGGGNFGGLVEDDNPALQAEIRSLEQFRFPVLARTAVVQRDPEGLDPLAQARAVTSAFAQNVDPPSHLQQVLGALPVPNALGAVPGAGERSTAVITYLFFRPSLGFADQTRLAEAYAGHYLDQPGDAVVGVTGVVPARVAQKEALEEHLPLVERATVAVIVAVVGLHFRSVGAPLLTIATAGVAFTVTVRLAAEVGDRLGVVVPRDLEPLMVALLLGVVTDYTIFFLAGMRGRIDAGEDRLTAARHATEEVGPILLTAGLTVAAGTLALLAARLELFRTFGPALALTIALSLVVAMTLAPALLAIAGRALFWPHRPPSQGGSVRRLGRRLPEVVTARRTAVAVAAGCTVVLALAALPLRDAGLGFTVLGSLPDDADAARAADAAGRAFTPGILSPTLLVVEADGITERLAALERLQGMLDAQPGVAGVAGPGDLPVPVELGAVLSPTGDAARYVLLLEDGPLTAPAIDNLRSLRERLPALLDAAGLAGVRTALAGDTAVAEDVVTATRRDIGRIAVAAVVVDFVLLVLFLRALVAPLYLLATSVLALAASLGLTTLLFQGVLDQPGLTFYVPFAAAVLLISLGSDYNIFGVGYIWEEARSRPLREAVVVAMQRSTPAITAAGLALALSFALLALVPLSPFREFAFAMAAGIVIDAFVVRTVLVPSLVTIVGAASAWPGRRLRRGADGGAPVAAEGRVAVDARHVD